MAEFRLLDGISSSVDLKLGASAISSSNDLDIEKDVNAPGGFAQSFVFYKNTVLQNTFSEMTCSIVSASAGSVGEGWYRAYAYVPMVRSGSILGLCISTRNSSEVVKSGAFSASVMLDRVNQACTVIMDTGTFGVTTVAKNTLTFNPGQWLGVSLTSSAEMLSEPGVTSASFVGTVLVEM